MSTAGPDAGLPPSQLLVATLILLGGGLVIWGRRYWFARRLQPKEASPAENEENGTPPPTTDGGTPRPQETTHRDSLTGLADRSLLLDTIEVCLDQSRTSSEAAPPALIALRISEYRDVTESFGHQAGQKLLNAVATRLVDVSPPAATTARVAEDTFAVFLPQADEEEAESLGQTVMDRFNEPFTIAGNPVPIEINLGIAIRPAPGAAFTTAEKMLQASYSAMHQVQRQGGGTVHVYQHSDEKETRRLQRRERLRQAIQEDELRLHYQPIVHLVSGETVGAEALVRWAHPERGLLSPADFIPLAEETGLVGELDRWVFAQALDDASEWTRSPDGPLDWVSVNISPQSVEGNLQQWCLKKLEAANLPEGSLHLEITERWALRD